MAEGGEHWTVDKRVPVAIIFAILVQSAGVVWFFSDQNARLRVVEQVVPAVATMTTTLERIMARQEALDARMVQTEQRDRDVDAEVRQLAQKVAVMLEQLTNLNENLRAAAAELEQMNIALRQRGIEGGGR